MSDIRFQGPAEEHVWALFFIKQCPQVTPKSKNMATEITAAAASADEMLKAWRSRAYEDEPPTEEPVAGDGP